MAASSIKGILCTHRIRDDHPGRRWVTVNLRLSALAKYFFIQPFDERDGTGWQREQSKAHIKNLSKAIDEDDYSPTVFVAHILPSHVNRLVYSEVSKPGYGKRTEVTIPLDPESKLALTDGGHRNMGFQKILKLLSKDERDLAENTDITVQIFLDPARIQQDFHNLQKGRPLNRNQAKTMQDLLDKDPVSQIVRQVACLMDGDSASFLFGQVDFTGRDRRPITYAGLTSKSKSDSCFTMYGGAKVAIASERDAEWLARSFGEAYRALKNTPEVIARGRQLCPSILGGSPSGTAFIIGIGSMWAWRKAFLGKESASKSDLERIASVANDVFGEEAAGLRAEMKRDLMASFSRRYFADMLADPGSKAGFRQAEDYDGHPKPLVDIWVPSSFCVDRARKKELASRGEPPKPLRKAAAMDTKE